MSYQTVSVQRESIGTPHSEGAFRVMLILVVAWLQTPVSLVTRALHHSLLPGTAWRD